MTYTAAEEAFRLQVRDFFENEYPRDIPDKLRNGDILGRADHIRSQRALQARGWLAIGWPQEHGGPGWDATRRYVFEEEMDRAGIPHLLPMAILYGAPVIYTFGNTEQQRRWLPDILESRSLWAQGYSEPEAGSDLASLRFRAERDGDHYILNGTKIWTSYAQWADWIFCLARTSKEDRKQNGISFICAEMTSPGITLYPIISIDGVHHLNRIEFENVRVPVTNRVGEEGRGWHYALFLLQAERLSYAHVARKKEDLKRLRRLAAELPSDNDGSMLDDQLFVRKIAACEVQVDVLEVSVLRVLTARSAAGPAEVSSLKIFATETAQRITELYVELAGRSVAPWPDRQIVGWRELAPGVPGFAAPWTASYLFERAQTIYGGATEVQKNIIWKMISR
ncbi:MAG TPA: acyl-CoA dehydrogenase family protein [Steroidobacteraceae bacterium]